MDSTDLSRCLRSDPTCNSLFAGVYAADELPRTMVGESLLLVNTDISSGFGIHWTAMYVSSQGTAEFFDSTGHPPEHYCDGFRQFLINNGPNYKFQKRRLQSVGSRLCGQYCLFYALRRCQGWTLDRVVDYFDGQTPQQNDEVIAKMFP